MTETQQTQGAELPEWADPGGSLEESQMERTYLQAEAIWRGEARRFYDREMELRARVKRSLDLTDEERATVYMVEHERIVEEFTQSADAFTNGWLDQRRRAHEAVHSNRTDGFRESLLRVSGMDEAELQRTYNIAQRSGQSDLSAAVAQVALENKQFGIFERWGRENPQMAANLQTLRRVPGFDQLYRRIHQAMGPPRVESPHHLRPGAAEIEEARQREENSRINVDLRQFFRGRAGRRAMIRPRR